ncbi:MAG: hypothetical protein GX640_13440, partial [Fibrobacter sp.]|nr:hypothetical protein [Fibrobacter sp.]
MKAAGKDSQNSVELTWDGTTDAGTVAKSGSYRIHIIGEEKDSSLYSFVQDVVDGVRFSVEGALIKVDGKELSIGSVLDVSTGAGGVTDGVSPSTAVSLLGKSVRVRESTVKFQAAENEVHNISINAPAGSTVRVNITDSKGKVVYYQNVKADSKGVAEFSWNGETVSGQIAPAATYTIAIPDAKSNPYIYAYSEGRIDGVSNISGGAQLRYKGKTISMSDILDISVSS